MAGSPEVLFAVLGDIRILVARELPTGNARGHLRNTLAAKNLSDFLHGVAADYTNVINTNFPERADAIAAEIARTRPALVGLQEVALYRTQFPYQTGPVTVSYDFLQILLDALAAHGMHYATVITRNNYSVAGAGLFSFGLMGVSLTERSALLARTDLPARQLQLSNPQQGGYVSFIPLTTINGTVPIRSGWLSVDATIHNQTVRFITTHLSAITLSLGVQPQQMQELLAGPAATTLPVVIGADLNSTPTDAAYAAAVAAGFTDEWTAAADEENGFTAFQVLPTINNPRSNLSVRIDDVLGRGPIEAADLRLVGANPSARTPSGLWPSDHAGVVARLDVGR